MVKNNIKNNKFLFTISIVIINFITFILGWLLFSEEATLIKLIYVTYILLFISYLIVYLFFCHIFDAFAFDRRKTSENAYSLSLSTLISLLCFYFLNTLAYRQFYSPRYLLVIIFVIVLENIILTRTANKVIFSNYLQKRAIVFYKDIEDLKNIKKLTYFDIKYKITKKIKNPKKTDINLDCDVVFISGINSSIRDIIVKKCLVNNVEAFVFPAVGDVIISGGRYVEELSVPMIKINSFSTSILYSFLKRVFDLLVSLIALIILSPFMIFTAVLIKLYDGGPILYKQTRLTKNYKEFTIYKFRSMKVDAEKDGIARISTKNDNRITPVGSFIRKIRFDELPQIFNIIKGDMSIVGPRPERPEIAKQYEKKYPSFGLRLQVKAGLTGYAQVYGKYNSSPDEKLKMDLFYINKKSFIYDVKMCFMTIKILFMKESTEALEEGSIIAGEK